MKAKVISPDGETERRRRFVGHCCRITKEPVSRILFWKPKHGKKKAGGPNLTYIETEYRP